MEIERSEQPMTHPDDLDRARRRRFLSWAATAPALAGLPGLAERSASAASSRTPAGPAHDVRAYGAVGDGIADETAPIQAAIDAARAAGGGAVLFPAGTYSTRT